jgi:hypothetical protein
LVRLYLDPDGSISSAPDVRQRTLVAEEEDMVAHAGFDHIVLSTRPALVEFDH